MDKLYNGRVERIRLRNMLMFSGQDFLNKQEE